MCYFKLYADGYLTVESAGSLLHRPVTTRWYTNPSGGSRDLIYYTLAGAMRRWHLEEFSTIPCAIPSLNEPADPWWRPDETRSADTFLDQVREHADRGPASCQIVKRSRTDVVVVSSWYSCHPPIEYTLDADADDSSGTLTSRWIWRLAADYLSAAWAFKSFDLDSGGPVHMAHVALDVTMDQLSRRVLVDVWLRPIRKESFNNANRADESGVGPRASRV